MLDIKKLLTKICDSMRLKTATFTAAQSGISNNLFIRQRCGIVTIYGWLGNATITANTETHLGTLSGIQLPNTNIRLVGSVGSNAYTMGTASYVMIATDGKIMVTSSNGGSGKAVYFNASYIGGYCLTVFSRLSAISSRSLRLGVA